MNGQGQAIRSAALRLRLSIARFGTAAGVAVALCVCGIAGLIWSFTYLDAQTGKLEAAVKFARQELRAAETAPVARLPVTEERLAAFYDTLGEKRFSEQQVRSLFAIAKKTGLSLNQAEYKASFEKNGRFHTYQILLPVKGSYGAIRQFCEQTLLTIPFASLDEMSFKRDSIGNGTLEAKLRFTLYLNDLAPANKEREDIPPEGGQI